MIVLITDIKGTHNMVGSGYQLDPDNLQGQELDPDIYHDRDPQNCSQGILSI